jgi:hypothetical protein
MYDKIRADYVTCSSRRLDSMRRQHLEVSYRSAINNILKGKDSGKRSVIYENIRTVLRIRYYTSVAGRTVAYRSRIFSP